MGYNYNYYDNPSSIHYYPKVGERVLSREFPKLGVPYSGVLIVRILLFRVLY